MRGFVVCAAIAMVPVQLVAQAPPADSLTARVNAAAQAFVRTAAARGMILHPRLVGDTLLWTDGTFRSQSSGRAVMLAPPLALGEVTRLEIRHGTHAGRGALVGGIAAGGLGLAFGVACAADEFLQCDPGQVVGITTIFGVAGAAVGALVGALIPAWRPVYVRP